MEPENLQSVLQEAGIQVEMRDLENPTEEFIIYLVTQYLNKLDVDGDEISKSTPEQLESLSCPESASHAIQAINLHSALSSICNEIFLKDLLLTDITSPGTKRARKQIKILVNFLHYAKNKMAEKEMAFLELDDKQKEIEHMINDKASTIAKIGALIEDRENKLELKVQLQQEIDNLRLEMEENNKKSKEQENQVKNVMSQHQEVFKKSSDLQAKAVQLRNLTTELQSKIVRSPEDYKARSEELQSILEIKKEEREVLKDGITRKRLQIKTNENAQELVNGLKDKFTINIGETFKKLKETTVKLECVQKELDQLKTDIARWSNVNSANSPKDIDQNGDEKILFELDNQYANAERDLHSQVFSLEELKTDLSKKKAMLENELKTILAVENENSDILKKYEEHFNNEISEELTLREEMCKIAK